MLKKLRALRLTSRALPHQEDAAFLHAENLSVRYDGIPALEDVEFQLQGGEQVAVVGPNGAGKSTLFKVIAGVLTPTTGHVTLSGHSPGGHICIAYLPQRSDVDWSFPVTVKDVVMMGRVGKIGFLRGPRTADWEQVDACLDQVNLASLAGRQISELSGGQQQRMFIAQALAQEAEIVMMDEPLSGLDLTSQDEVFQIMARLRELGVTLFVATHDLSLAAARFDQVMLLKNRILGFGRPDEIFTPERLQAAYGKQLHLLQSKDGLLVLGDQHR